jgi:hypothetical protein
MRYIWMPLAAMLLLVGCAHQTLVYNEQLSPAYRPTEYGYGAGRRDFTTVIQGNPFELGEEEFQAQFVDLLNRNQPILQPTHFTTTPGPSARPAYRAVFAFNTRLVLPNQMCVQPLDLPPAEVGDTIRVSAAFCRWQGALTSVTGEVAVDSIDDPRFESMIGQMMWLLFPPVDPSQDNIPPWFRVTGPGGALQVSRPTEDLAAG